MNPPMDQVQQASSAEDIRNLIAYLVRSLAHRPERVRVELTQAKRDLEIHVFVAAEDLAEVNGPGGETARSLRVIANAAGMKLGCHFCLKINACGPFKTTK